MMTCAARRSRLLNSTPRRDNASAPMTRFSEASLACGRAKPFPNPVDPSSSRFRSAATTCSSSARSILRWAANVDTISRIASSLFVARSSGKNASQISGCSSLFRARSANHARLPQCGQGASPGGVDGSMQNEWPQTGQRYGEPSGVRDEIVMASARKKPAPRRARCSPLEPQRPSGDKLAMAAKAVILKAAPKFLA